MSVHFKSIKFKNYKAFKNYTVALAEFNILVGPNNAGKSTILGAFRILAEGLKKASYRNAEYIDSAAYRGYGHKVALTDLPISTENIFNNYDDSVAADVEFQLTSGAVARLIFPENDTCFLVAESAGKILRTTTEFKRTFTPIPSFVPVLGPVEHDERQYQEGAARSALQTHRASRNFRNIWHHYRENFEDFRNSIRQTWPGMDIKLPESSRDSDGILRLHMFCAEGRYEREIFWAGFGFQVWAQLLTFIVKASPESLLLIDEPDIYLHSDLQRQLVHILKSRGGDVLIATHSTEIITEADPTDIVVVGRTGHSSKRISKPLDLKSVFSTLGSSLTPILTQLAKTKRVLFVEGNDFGLIASFARKLGRHEVANQNSFAIVPANGFNPARVRDFSDGMETTLGCEIARAVVFDRDYRTEEEVQSLTQSLLKSSSFVRVHARKELENFLLIPSAMHRAMVARLHDRAQRGGDVRTFSDDVSVVLDEITADLKHYVFGQYSARQSQLLREAHPEWNQATIHRRVLETFDCAWASLDERLRLVPGKEVLAAFNQRMQSRYSVSLSPTGIVKAMAEHEVPDEMKDLISGISQFAVCSI